MGGWLSGTAYAAGLVVGLFVLGRVAAVALGWFGARWKYIVTVQANGAAMAIAGGIYVAGAFLPTEAIVGGPAIVVVDAIVMAALAAAALGAFKRGLRPVTVDGSAHFVAPPWQYRLVVVGTILVLTLALTAIGSGLVPVGLGLLLPVLVTLWFARRQLQLRLAPMSMGAFRPPTAAERERVAACYDRLDRAPPEIAVVPPEIEYDAFLVYGLGSTRWLIATAAVLAELSDEELAVALAQADEKHRNGFHRVQTVSVLAGAWFFPWVLVQLVQAVPEIPSAGAKVIALAIGPGTVLWFAVVLPLSYVSRRRQYAADTFAGGTLGAETVRAVYEQVGDRVWSVPPDIPLPIPDDVVHYLSPAPPMDRRLERVDSTAAAD